MTPAEILIILYACRLSPRAAGSSYTLRLERIGLDTGAWQILSPVLAKLGTPRRCPSPIMFVPGTKVAASATNGRWPRSPVRGSQHYASTIPRSILCTRIPVDITFLCHL
jgi:hypothetical protein